MFKYKFAFVFTQLLVGNKRYTRLKNVKSTIPTHFNEKQQTLKITNKKIKLTGSNKEKEFTKSKFQYNILNKKYFSSKPELKINLVW